MENLTNEQKAIKVHLVAVELETAFLEAILLDQEKVDWAERERKNRTRLLNARTALSDLRVEY